MSVLYILLAILIVLWLLSPLFFIPYYIYLSHKNKKIKNENVNANANQNVNQNNFYANRALRLIQTGVISQQIFEFIFAPKKYSGKPDVNTENQFINPQDYYSQSQQSNVFQNENVAQEHNNFGYVGASGEQNIYNDNHAQIPNYEYAQQQESTKHTFSTMNILTALGSAFIIIAGALFVISSWSQMTTILKILIMLSACGIFFGLSSFTEKKLKIKSTGFALFSVAIILLPVTIIGMGFLKLFGESLSLPNGEHGLLVLAIATLALSFVSMAGVKKYRNKAYAFTVMAGTSLAYVFFIFDLNFANSTQSFLLALNAVIVMCLSEFIKRTKLESYKSIVIKFGVCNTVLISALTLFVIENGILSAFSMFMVGGIYLSKTFVNEKKSAGIIPFAIFLLVGLFRLFDPSKVNGLSLVFSTAVVTIVILTELSLFNDIAKKIMRIISIVFSTIAFFASGLILPINYRLNTVENIISIVLLLASISWTFYKTKSKFIASFHSLVTIVLIFSISNTIFEFASNFYVVAVLLIFVAWAIYYVTKQMRTFVGDCAFLITCACLMITYSNDYSGYLELVLAVIFAIMSAVMVFGKSDSKAYISLKIAYPLSMVIIFAVIFSFMEDHNVINSFEKIVFAYFAIAIALGLVLNFMKKEYFKFNLLGLDITIFSMGVYSIIIFSEVAVALILGFMTVAYCFVRYISIDNSKTMTKKIYAFICVNSSIFATFFISLEAILHDSYYQKPMCNLSIVCLCEFAILMVLKYSKKWEEHRKNFQIPITLFMIGVPLFSYYLLHESLESISVAATMANFWLMCLMFAISYGLLSVIKINIFSIIPIFFGYKLLSDYLVFESIGNNTYVSIMILLEILLSILGRVQYNNKLSDSTKPLKLDCLTITSGLSCIFILNYTNSGSAFFLAVTVYLAGYYYKRFTWKNSDKTILTLMLSSMCRCIALQKLVEIPEIISLEIKILPLFILAVALRYIWKEYRNGSDISSFSVISFALLVLLIDVMNTQKAVDVILFIIASVLLLFASMVIKRKKWLLLSLGLTIFTPLYMMKPMFNRLSWWVYLLVLGVILISIAAVREYNKAHKDSQVLSEIKEKATDFYQEWDW